MKPDNYDKKKYLFNPTIDFLCLGGLSFLVLPFMVFIPDTNLVFYIGISFIIADFINHPHFAISYQIFYRSLFGSLKDQTVSPVFKARMIFSAFFLPMSLFIYFSICLANNNNLSLGYMVNVMLFLVGWHYVKQGYGMLMLDSVLKKKYFNEKEKNLLRLNGYLGWLFFWVVANAQIKESQYVDIHYFTFGTPKIIIWALGLAFLVSTVFVIALMKRRLQNGGAGVPLAGFVAYIMSIYIWLLGRYSPSVIIFIPALHSLQYLVVVSRYEINRQTAKKNQTKSTKILYLLLTVSFAVLLGYYGFWEIPSYLDNNKAYDKDIFGNSVYIVCFWLFINIHHYFIDNVIWRKDNKETRVYLYGR